MWTKFDLNEDLSISWDYRKLNNLHQDEKYLLRVSDKVIPFELESPISELDPDSYVGVLSARISFEGTECSVTIKLGRLWNGAAMWSACLNL